MAALSVFLVVMTNLVLLIGAGLFSRAVGAYQKNAFNHLSAFSFYFLFPCQRLMRHPVSGQMSTTQGEMDLALSTCEATSGISTAAMAIITRTVMAG